MESIKLKIYVQRLTFHLMKMNEAWQSILLHKALTNEGQGTLQKCTLRPYTAWQSEDFNS